MTGRCDARPDLPGRAIPLEVHVPVLRSRGGADVVERLFAPLGWQVTATALPLDEEIPAWGDSPYVDLRLTGTLRLADALTQLYVLLPALDDAKHYWVGHDEVEKLLRAGAGWLAAHPERELVTRRYLRHRRALVTTAVGRLAEVDDAEPEALDNAVPEDPQDPQTAEDDAPPKEPLVRLRHAAVLHALREEHAATVADVGCGDGPLLRHLVDDPAFTRILGTDAYHRALEVAAQRLHLDRMPDRKRARIELLQSSVTYRDDRLAGFDAVVLMEVVEHLDPPRLPALARTVFGHARPASVVVTTPNAEYNVRYETLPEGRMRHHDHRFEWTREEFRAWAAAVAAAHGYTVRHVAVGDDDPEVGPPTQLAVFRRVA